MSDDLTLLARAFLAQGYEQVETHISRVFLGEREVYKLKRPVNLGFLDFSSAAARREACEAEVVLNRRLAAGVYLGVVATWIDPNGALRIVPADAAPGTCEWAVHMRRLRDADRADHLLAQGTLGLADIDIIARMLAVFHQRARSDAATRAFGEPASIAENVEENFRQVEPTIGRHLRPEQATELEGFQRQFLRERADVLRGRAAAGRVRDGHGDLRLEHLYRTPEGDFLAIDCIEFNERFRFADVCNDLAFLAMDLAHHARDDLAEHLVASYAQASGDYGLYDVLDFYASYRAVVRAKVSSFLAVDSAIAPATRERADAEARRYYLLALSAARREAGRARLIVMSGGIASGKSSLAETLGKRLAVPVLSADRTRKELLGLAPTQAQPDASFRGAYSSDMTERVYARLAERATHVLRSGRSVILDASFRCRAQRDTVRELARGLDKPVLFFECRCPREIALARLAERAKGPSVSDGRAEIYDEFAASFEPLDELPPAQHRVLDTGGPRQATVECALRELGEG